MTPNLAQAPLGMRHGPSQGGPNCSDVPKEKKNKGTKSDALVKVETLFSDNVEFHEMSMKNNIMKMKKIDGGLKVPGGDELVLKPGGYHIMFKNLLKNLGVGKTEKAILYFEKTGKIIIKFEIHDMKHSH